MVTPDPLVTILIPPHQGALLSKIGVSSRRRRRWWGSVRDPGFCSAVRMSTYNSSHTCEVVISHGTFVGVVVMVFFGLNSVRVGIAAVLGLYPDLPFALISLLAVVPAIGGVALGKRLRPVIAARYRRSVVLGLPTFVGLRLVLTPF